MVCVHTVEVGTVCSKVLVVHTELANGCQLSLTILCRCRTVCAVEAVCTTVVGCHANLCRQIKTFQRGDYNAPIAVKHIAVSLCSVVLVVADSIADY